MGKNGGNGDDNDDFRKMMEEHLDANPPAPKTQSGMERLDKRSNSGKPRSSATKHSIDLHGKTLDEAKAALRSLMNQLAKSGGEIELRVITGKGRNSGSGGGVLAREIYDFFKRSFSSDIVRIDTDPMDTMIGGLPLRGHFDALLRF